MCQPSDSRIPRKFHSNGGLDQPFEDRRSGGL
jgi:hypothetical protein